MLTRGQEIDVDVDEVSAIDVELAAGEMSLHYKKIFHASPRQPRQGPAHRARGALHSNHVRQVAIEGDSAALVRGVDTYNHFCHEPRPVRDMDPRSSPCANRPPNGR